MTRRTITPVVEGCEMDAMDVASAEQSLLMKVFDNFYFLSGKEFRSGNLCLATSIRKYYQILVYPKLLEVICEECEKMHPAIHIAGYLF